MQAPPSRVLDAVEPGHHGPSRPLPHLSMEPMRPHNPEPSSEVPSEPRPVVVRRPLPHSRGPNTWSHLRVPLPLLPGKGGAGLASRACVPGDTEGQGG